MAETFSSGFATKATIGVMLCATKIDNMVIGGPAFGSGKLARGDEILAIGACTLARHRLLFLESVHFCSRIEAAVSCCALLVQSRTAYCVWCVDAWPCENMSAWVHARKMHERRVGVYVCGCARGCVFKTPISTQQTAMLVQQLRSCIGCSKDLTYLALL